MNRFLEIVIYVFSFLFRIFLPLAIMGLMSLAMFFLFRYIFELSDTEEFILIIACGILSISIFTELVLFFRDKDTKR